MNEWDIDLKEPVNAQGLCAIIEEKCQPDINQSIRSIEQYFQVLSENDLPDETLELIQILYAKLQDEIQHLFLKESGIIYPGIKNTKASFYIDQKASDTIRQTQQVIINLLIKLRHLLNNFVVKPDSSQEWKKCVQEFFLLENKIHQWIYIEQNLLYPSITHK